MMKYKYFKNNEGELYRIHIEYDNTPWNPRTDDDGNIGTMMCWRRYNLGDYSRNLWHSPREFMEELYGKYFPDDNLHELSFAQMIRRLEREKDFVFIPLYLLAHSGLSISTSDFRDNWDSGQCGWIYTTKETILATSDVTEIDWREKAKEWLEDEVKLYDMYLRGECYEYIIERRREGKWLDTNESFYEWWGEDSCCGFYSDKYGDELLAEIALEATEEDLYDTPEEAMEA